MIRRVSSSNFILDDVLDKQEELEQDGASFFDRGHDGVALSSFWQGVQRGLFVSEGHQRNSKPNSSRVILNNVDEEELARLGLINPIGKLKMLWDVVVGLLVLYVSIAVPIEIGFDLQRNAARRAASIFITIIFGMDIVVNFFTVYVDKERQELELNRVRIAQRYLSFWFWIDAASTLPFDLIITSSGKDSRTQTLRFVRILRLARVAKLSRLFNLDYLEHILDPAVVNLVIILTRLIYFVHLLACLWHFIGLNLNEIGYDRTWLTNPNSDLILNSLSDRYVASLYFCFVTILTIGYGDITATNEVERLFAIFIMIMGVLVFATLINKISTIVRSRRAEATATKRKLDMFKENLAKAKIPAELAKRATMALAHYLKRRTAAEESEILQEMPILVRREFVRRVYRDDMERVKFLHHLDASVITDIMLDSRPCRLHPGEILLQEGDLCQDLVFVKTGMVEMSIQVALPGLPGRPVERPLGCVMHSGFFGDAEWLLHTTALTTYKARNHCTLMLLSYSCLERILSKHGSTRTVVQHLVQQRCDNLRFTIERIRTAAYERATFRSYYCRPLRFRYELRDFVWMDGKVIQLGSKRLELDDLQDQQDARLMGQAAKKLRCVTLLDGNVHVVERDAEEIRRKKFLIFPWDRWKLLWDLLIAGLVLLCMLLIPVEIAFTPVSEQRAGLNFDVLVNVCFVVDTVLLFFSSYFSPDHEAWTISRRLIAQAQLTSWAFYIDIISVLPYGVIAASLSPRAHGLFTALATLRVLKLTRILRVIKLRSRLLQLEDMINLSPLVISLGRTTFQTFMVAHWMSCLWWGLTSVISHHPWFTDYGPDGLIYRKLQGQATSAQYLVSFYFVIATLTSTGYGDIRATNTPERVVVIVVAVVGVIAFSYTIAGISNAFNTFIAADDVLKSKIARIAAYLEEKRCPTELKAQILQQYERKLQEFAHEDIQDILKRLPSRLSASILVILHDNKLRRIPIFQYIPVKTIQVYLFQLMTPTICEEGYHLFREGKVVRELYFFVDGAGVIYRRMRKKIHGVNMTRAGSSQDIAAVLNERAVFAENAITQHKTLKPSGRPRKVSEWLSRNEVKYDSLQLIHNAHFRGDDDYSRLTSHHDGTELYTASLSTLSPEHHCNEHRHRSRAQSCLDKDGIEMLDLDSDYDDDDNAETRTVVSTRAAHALSMAVPWLHGTQDRPSRLHDEMNNGGARQQRAWSLLGNKPFHRPLSPTATSRMPLMRPQSLPPVTCTHQPAMLLSFDNLMQEFQQQASPQPYPTDSPSRQTDHLLLGMLSPLQLLGSAVQAHETQQMQLHRRRQLYRQLGSTAAAAGEDGAPSGEEGDKHMPLASLNHVLDDPVTLLSSMTSHNHNDFASPRKTQHRSQSLKAYVAKHKLSWNKLRRRDFTFLGLEKIQDIQAGEFSGHLAFLIESRRQQRQASIQPTSEKLGNDYLPNHIASLCITRPTTVYALNPQDVVKIMEEQPTAAFELQQSLIQTTVHQLHDRQRRRQREQRTLFVELLRVKFIQHLWYQRILPRWERAKHATDSSLNSSERDGEDPEIHNMWRQRAFIERLLHSVLMKSRDVWTRRVNMLAAEGYRVDMQSLQERKQRLPWVAKKYLARNPWDADKIQVQTAAILEDAIRTLAVLDIAVNELERLHAMDKVLLEERTEKSADDDFSERLRKRLIKRQVHTRQHLITRKIQKVLATRKTQKRSPSPHLSTDAKLTTAWKQAHKVRLTPVASSAGSNHIKPYLANNNRVVGNASSDERRAVSEDVVDAQGQSTAGVQSSPAVVRSKSTGHLFDRRSSSLKDSSGQDTSVLDRRSIMLAQLSSPKPQRSLRSPRVLHSTSSVRRSAELSDSDRSRLQDDAAVLPVSTHTDSGVSSRSNGAGDAQQGQSLPRPPSILVPSSLSTEQQDADPQPIVMPRTESLSPHTLRREMQLSSASPSSHSYAQHQQASSSMQRKPQDGESLLCTPLEDLCPQKAAVFLPRSMSDSSLTMIRDLESVKKGTHTAYTSEENVFIQALLRHRGGFEGLESSSDRSAAGGMKRSHDLDEIQHLLDYW